MTHFNGSGEGILWVVTKVDGSWLKLQAMFTVTGPSVLKPKRVQYHAVEPADIVALGTAYVRLGLIIQDIVKMRSEDAGADQPQDR